MANKEPLEPWVMKARTGVIAVGLAWPIVLVLGSIFFGEHDTLVWALIGITFLITMFAPVALAFSLIVPTMKARVLALPFLPLAYFVSFGEAAINYPTVLVVPLWMVTFTAVTLFLPEVRTMRMLYARIFLKPPAHP